MVVHDNVCVVKMTKCIFITAESFLSDQRNIMHGTHVRKSNIFYFLLYLCAGPFRRFWMPKAKDQLGLYTQNILIKCNMKESNPRQNRHRKSLTSTRPACSFVNICP